MNYSKNKQIFLLLIMLMWFSLSTFGQNMYVSANIGYSAKMSSMGLMYKTTVDSVGNTNWEYVSGSLGRGTSINASFGFIFGKGKHLGVELNTSYLIGTRMRIKDDFSFGSNTRSMSANMISLVPAIVILGGGEKIRPYAKFGVVIAKATITEANISDNTLDDILEEEITVMRGGITSGLQAGLGATYKLNETFSLLAEISATNMSYTPTNASLVKATRNGEDILPTLSTFEKEIIFVKVFDFTAPSSSSSPREAFQTPYPFGSVGLHLGARFEF